jgi:hypothetical protein
MPALFSTISSGSPNLAPAGMQKSTPRPYEAARGASLRLAGQARL